jgi:chromosome segregation ATPase
MFSFLNNLGSSSDDKSVSGGDAASSSSSSEVASLKSEIESLRRLLTKTEAKAEAATALNNDGSDIGTLRTKLADTESKLTLTMQELADAVQKYRLLVIDASKAAHSEVKTNDAIKDTIQKQNYEMGNIAKDQQKDIQDLRDQLAALKAQLQDRDEKIHDLKKENADRHKEWTDNTAQLVNQIGDHKQTHSNVISTVAGELQNEQKKNEHVANNVGDTQNKAIKATADAEKAKEKVAVFEAVVAETQAQNLVLQSSVADLTSTSETLKSTNQQLNQQITETRNQQIALQAQIVAMKDQIAKANRDKDQVAAEAERKQDALKDKLLDAQEELRKTAEDLNRALADAAKAKAAQDQLAKTLADTRDLHDKTLGAKDAAHDTASTATQQVAGLLADAEQKAEQYRNERKALLDKIDDLMRNLNAATTDSMQAQKRIDDVAAQKTKEMTKLMDAHAKENEANAQQLKQLKTINDNLVAQLDDANKKLRAAQRQNDVDQSKIGALEADLKAAREKLADLPAQLSAAKGEAATNQKLYEGALVQIGDLRTKMNTLLQENTELGSRIEAVTSQSSASSQTTQVELK